MSEKRSSAKNTKRTCQYAQCFSIDRRSGGSVHTSKAKQNQSKSNKVQPTPAKPDEIRASPAKSKKIQQNPTNCNQL